MGGGAYIPQFIFRLYEIVLYIFMFPVAHVGKLGMYAAHVGLVVRQALFSVPTSCVEQ